MDDKIRPSTDPSLSNQPSSTTENSLLAQSEEETSLAYADLPGVAVVGISGPASKDKTDKAVHTHNTSEAGNEGQWGNSGSSREAWNALGTGLLYLVLFRTSTRLPFSVTSTVFITLAVLVLLLVFTVRLARAIRTDGHLLINGLLSLLFTGPLILIPVLITRFPTWQGWNATLPRFGQYIETLKHVLGLKELLVIWLAVTIGVAISRMIREFKLLLPIAVVLAIVDFFTVLGGGVVQQAVNGTNSTAVAAMSALTVKLPSTRVTAGSAPIQLVVGFADFLFIALFFACFQRFGIPAWRTFIVLTTVLIIYMVVVFYTGIALPALVPIAVVVIAMNLRRFRYDRSEATALLIAGILVSVIIGLLYWAGHR